MKSKLIFGLLLGLHFLLLLSTQFTAWPEMLLWPYLVLRGWAPYQDIAIAHSPVLILFESIFYGGTGVSLLAQKLFSWLVVLATDIVFYIVAKRQVGISKTLFALGVYVLLQVYYQGNGIWFDHLLALFALLMFNFAQRRQSFATGIAWGFALLVKQTAFWFALPLVLFHRHHDIFKGVVVVGILFLACLVILGLDQSFIAWAFSFGVLTLPRLSGQVNFPNLRELAAAIVPFTIILPGLLLSRKKRIISLSVWAVAGLLGALPRFELFHFQPALPFLALVSAELFSDQKKLVKSAFVVLAAVSLIMIVRSYSRNLNQAPRFATSADNKIVEVVDKLTNPGDQIFITNYWDNLYPQTQTVPATRPFVPQLSWYLAGEGINGGILSDLDRNLPKVVVRGQGSSTGFGVINAFIDSRYQKADTINGIDILIPK